MTAKIDMPKSDTERARSIEPDVSWPDRIEIVAHKGKKSQRVEITREHYFGMVPHGSPVTGQWLLFQIEQLRKKLA